jgi:hypothetical protein
LERTCRRLDALDFYLKTSKSMIHVRIKLVFSDASRMFPAGKIGVSSGTGLAELKPSKAP